MPSFVIDLILAIYYGIAGIADSVLGRKRKRYEASTVIKAPRDTVWEVVSAHSIKFDGIVPIEISGLPRNDGSGIVDSRIKIGDQQFPMTHKIVAERPGEGMLIEIVEAGTHPKLFSGRDYRVAVTLLPADNGTLMSVSHELTHKNFAGRITVPIGLRQNVRRLKQHAEKLAGVGGQSLAQAVIYALVTGALTFASFLYLFDVSAAVMLIALLLLHELGHVLAMRWLGIPVKGIYFIPFFGAVAAGAGQFRDEGERGLVAIMGPGMSLISTAAFYAAAHQTGEPIYRELTLMSAMLNGFNLLPVMPLDGGMVMAALFSRLDREISRLIQLTALVSGIAGSVYMEWYVLTGLFLLTIPAILSNSPANAALKPAGGSASMLLACGYVSAFVAYVCMAAATLTT